MSYHLARVMYFIQNQNTDFFNASYWAQVFHPVYSSYLNIAFFMLFGDEKGMNLVQFIGGCFSAFSVFGIALFFSENIIPSILSGCLFLNLTQVNLQMTSTQNDLWMSSLLGCSLYFLILLKDKKSINLVFLSCLGVAISLGGKLSGVLYIPSILVLLLITIEDRKTQFWYCIIFALLASFIFFTSGYWENLTHFGTIAGSQEVVEEHSFKHFTIIERLQFGVENTFRYSVHFFSLDGMPDIGVIREVHREMKKISIAFFQLLGANLYNQEGTRSPFVIDGPYANENISYWGILGFLVWISVFSSIFVKRFRHFSPLAFCAIIFLLAQSFSSQYDPWRGRYFIACAIFAAPITSLAFQRYSYHKIVSLTLIMFLGLGSFSSLTTLFFRGDRPLIPYRGMKSILTMNRIEQLTSERTVLTQPAIAITNWIDRYPHFPLYTILPANFHEYILFRGNQVIPLNGILESFQEKMLTSIDSGLLLYDRKIYPDRQAEDIRFGANLFGRIIGEELQ
ncbi:MAG: glycosyltransferase family 39 protein [Cyanobacteria bacterium SBLK]|nr:glycosyltransferase family 39 protein [Cyanobacteria bacterium SBLK]